MGAGKSRKSARDLQSVPAPPSTGFILVFVVNMYISRKKSADFSWQPRGNQKKTVDFQMAIKTSSENFRNFCDRFWKALV
eukprot:SAG11_NODE_31705_length_289_cov_5.147368_1_plen_79_part_10